ncbi:hypothetical protein MMC30_008608 [Trapelia coarctata]|nr:hypothetical protein [Trapelia coarctata]
MELADAPVRDADADVEAGAGDKVNADVEVNANIAIGTDVDANTELEVCDKDVGKTERLVTFVLGPR